MPSINNIAKQIEKKQRIIIQDALTSKVRHDIFEIIQEYLQELVYNSSTPSQYERSYTLLHSLKVSNVTKLNNGFSVKIYIPNEVQNTSKEYKMRYPVSEIGLKKGESPTSADVGYILENGLNQFRNKADFINQSSDYIRQNNMIVESFKIYLKSKGIKAI